MRELTGGFGAGIRLMLRITKQTDYAIVILTHFAVKERSAVHNARDLAQMVNLPLPTTSKILKALARADLLTSHRGVKGGYALAREPKNISVREIVCALEGPIAITECLDLEADPCGIEKTCPARANWQRINQAVRNALDAIPLSEMASGMSFSSRTAEV